MCFGGTLLRCAVVSSILYKLEYDQQKRLLLVLTILTLQNIPHGRVNSKLGLLSWFTFVTVINHLKNVCSEFHC